MKALRLVLPIPGSVRSMVRYPVYLRVLYLSEAIFIPVLMVLCGVECGLYSLHLLGSAGTVATDLLKRFCNIYTQLHTDLFVNGETVNALWLWEPQGLLS